MFGGGLPSIACNVQDLLFDTRVFGGGLPSGVDCRLYDDDLPCYACMLCDGWPSCWLVGVGCLAAASPLVLAMCIFFLSIEGWMAAASPLSTVVGIAPGLVVDCRVVGGGLPSHAFNLSGGRSSCSL